MAQTRTADPWRDTEVIDFRAARFGQGVTGVVALAGVVFGWPLAWALMAAQLAIGVTLGRRWCIPCVVYFVWLQPRIGEGEVEDARPPRLANMIGIAFLGSAAALWWAGAETAGTAVAGLVAFLALLSASTGFCAGCEIYRLGARLRGDLAHPQRPDRPRRPAAARRCRARPRRVHAPALLGVPRLGAAAVRASRAPRQHRRPRTPRPRPQVRDRDRARRVRRGRRRRRRRAAVLA